jgi:hypothetical protein
MKKVLLFTIACICTSWLSAQFVYKIKADSVLITNDSCNAELNLENSTKDTLGFLYNKGKGRTEFRRMVKKIDSVTYVIGGTDTIKTGGSSIANTIYTGDGTITGTRNVNFTTIGGGISFNMKTATDPSFTRFKNSYFMTNPDWGGRVFATYAISEDDSAINGFSVVNDGGGVNRGNELSMLIMGSKNAYNFGGQSEGTFIRADRQPLTIISDINGNPAAAYPIQFYTGTHFWQDNTNSIPTLRLNGNQTIDVKSTIRLGNLTSDPTGNNGMLYYNSTNNKFRGYQNGAWIDIIGGGGSGLLTADNGLTANTSTNVQLGGTLLNSTTVTGGSNTMTFTSTAAIITNTLNGINTGAGNGIFGQAASGTGVAGASNSGPGGTFTSTSNVGISVNSTSAHAASFGIFPSSTNTIATMLAFQRNSSGSAADGIGMSIDMATKTSDGSLQNSNQIISKWTTANTATRTSQFIITGVNAGTTGNKFVLSGNGALQLPGYGSGNFTGTATKTLQVDASGNIIEGSTNVKQLKAASIQSPTSSENVTLFYTAEAITVNSVREVITGGTSVTYSLVYSSTRTGSTTNIVSSHAASSTTGANASIANASVPGGSWVWIISTGVNGSVTEFHLTVNYQQQ